MRILLSTLILLFAHGCTLGADSNQNASTSNASENIVPIDPLAGIDLNDVYNGFISYVKDVQEKYKKGELEQPDNNPPDPNEIFIQGFGWTNPKSLDWYLTLQPIELRGTTLIVIMEEDFKSKAKDPPKWWINMGWEGTSWVPRGEPLPIYSSEWPDKLPTDSLPEENYDPSFDGGKWNYTWPHEFLPSSFDSAEIISSPVEPNINNKGRTKSNWGKPVIIHTSNNTEIEIKCNKYQKPISIGGLVPVISYKQIRIDGKKVWIGQSKNKEVTMIQFFVSDVLYKIQQNGQYNQDDCYDIIKQITQFMHSKLTENENESKSIEEKLQSVDSLSAEEVSARIESLREFIISPKGVSKDDVDAIFGVSEVITEFTKGSASNYPMNIYQLLTPESKQEFRAVLYVTYKEDIVTYIGINHLCVTKNRRINLQDSPEQIKRQQEIERENVQVLKDLIEIEGKYKSKLEEASWNM